MSDRDQPMRSSMLLDDHLPAAGAIEPRHRLHPRTPRGPTVPRATASSHVYAGNFLDSFCLGHVRTLLHSIAPAKPSVYTSWTVSGLMAML